MLTSFRLPISHTQCVPVVIAHNLSLWLNLKPSRFSVHKCSLQSSLLSCFFCIFKEHKLLFTFSFKLLIPKSPFTIFLTFCIIHTLHLHLNHRVYIIHTHFVLIVPSLLKIQSYLWNFNIITYLKIEPKWKNVETFLQLVKIKLKPVASKSVRQVTRGQIPLWLVSLMGSIGLH